jgi:hypothetical protein
MKANISFQFCVHIVHFSACDLLCLGVQVHQPMTKKLTHSVPLTFNLSENGNNLDGTDTTRTQHGLMNDMPDRNYRHRWVSGNWI